MHYLLLLHRRSWSAACGVNRHATDIHQQYHTYDNQLAVEAVSCEPVSRRFPCHWPTCGSFALDLGILPNRGRRDLADRKGLAVQFPKVGSRERNLSGSENREPRERSLGR
jgi:hypothetical protein